MCQERIGANITLMIREIKKKKILLTPIQATLFLIGLYEDTGSLTFSSTKPEDAHAAAYLLEKKADFIIGGPVRSEGLLPNGTEFYRKRLEIARPHGRWHRRL